MSTVMDILPLLEGYQQRDVEHLVDLLAHQDPRGIEQMIAEDPQTTHVVEKVRTYEEGKHEITFDGGWGTIVTGVPKIAVGDIVGLFQEGDANGRHGWSLNGDVVEYETPFERFASRLKMLAGFDRDNREMLDRSRDDLARWTAEMEGPYAARIERFRAQNPAFDVESGGYEIYPVLMAQRIERHCREQGITVVAFRDLGYDEQKVVVHAGAEDKYGISGHQFDSACSLARAVMAEQGIQVRTFSIREEHLKLLRAAYVGWDPCEYGAPAIDCKRPYGNSYVPGDIREITGLDISDEACAMLHHEMQTVLQIVLRTADLAPAGYVCDSEYGEAWRRVEATT